MIELNIKSAGYEKKEILHNISLSFKKGKLTSIIGPNGCGKTTLLKTTLGIVGKIHGEITVDNEDIFKIKRKALAKRVAYLAQGKSVPDMTVGQMVMHGRFPHLNYPRRYTARDAEIANEAMKKVGISEFASYSMASLSSGMRQNAYIAMALAQSTDYILLDEPTTYLDISHQIALMNILRQLASEGKGIIAVMHDLPIAFTYSDEIVAINNGSIAARGTPDKILKTGIIEEIFNVEMKTNDNQYHYQLPNIIKRETDNIQ